MAKVKTSVVFKQYSPQQNLLLPPSLEELIGKDHLVRVVNEVVELMDISDLINLYKGGGTSSYHPRMLLKVLLYAYCVKIYTGRKIAKALSQDIHFMWLSAMNRPDFRTINNFRSSKAKQVIEALFKELLEFLVAHQYIKLENYFCDGTTLRADANQHKMVWKKNAERYGLKAVEKCQELFKQIDELNRQEDKAYGQADLEEHGQAATVSREAIAQKAATLNDVIRNTVVKSKRRKATTLKKKLKDAEGKIEKYNNQIQKAGNRSGYNKTDTDATAMMMKNKVEVLPAYNVLAGSEDQFITGVSVHQSTNDGACFNDHLHAIASQQPCQPDRIIADSIFGTEQNYELLQQNEIASYMKFPLYHKEQTKAYQQNSFLKDNFIYDILTNTYSCPNKQLLIFKGKHQQTHKRTGYKSEVKVYECNNCSGCPFYQQCCKSTKGENRKIEINEKLEAFKQQARQNLHTELGQSLKKQRGTEIESCFGDIKHNMDFRRFHLRGLQKVKTEFILVAMAHNLRKVSIKKLNKAA
ncbi:IS1182 family transposase [Niabella sp. CJ426]|uniref:IS1182 family transposase n=1 Tax=Niabella sp. CJ426 TaxID=3393740 RepID=UPI003D03F94F